MPRTATSAAPASRHRHAAGDLFMSLSLPDCRIVGCADEGLTLDDILSGGAAASAAVILVVLGNGAPMR